MITSEQALARAKSLRWVANQIPDELGSSNEDKMLKCIKLYCNAGAEAIEQLVDAHSAECNHLN